MRRPAATPVDRRQFLQLAGAGYVALLGFAGGGYGLGRLFGTGGPSSVPEGHARSFHSRPDLRPPAVEVVRHGDPVPGYMFVAPMGGPGQRGPLILDQAGEPVWCLPTPKGKALMNFAVQEYRGRPVLTWFDGVVGKGYGRGEYVIADASYRELARVRAGNGYRADLHEMQLTPQGTALLSAWRAEPADLRPAGGPRRGRAVDNVLQEIDVASGRVLFEWHSLDHVDLAETHSTVPEKGALDYFHLNSIDLQSDGSLLVSARNTWALYEIDRAGGNVRRRIGGKRSDYRLGDDVRFAWQHDARRQRDGTISVFDDGAKPAVEKRSRGLVLAVDDDAMTVELAQAYEHPGDVLAFAMGSMQPLAGVGAFVGWGTQPYASEFGPDGTLRLDLQLPHGAVSYRAYKRPWTGLPADAPALAAKRRPDGSAVAWASWNGATEVVRWRASTGPRADALRPAATVERSGFETAIELGRPGAYVGVAALDRGGRTLGTATPVAL